MTYEECMARYSNIARYCIGLEKAEAAPLDFVANPFGSVLATWPAWLAALLFIVLLAMSIKIIPQQSVGVVERFGRYHRSLNAGFNMVIPFIERVAHDVDLEQLQMKVTPLIKTKDDQIVDLSVVVMFRVIPGMASDSVYQVDDPEEAIAALVNNEVKAKASGMSLQEIFDDRKEIETAVDAELTTTVNSWGYAITKVVIDDPALSEEMRSAYNSVGVAKQRQLAAIAEGAALKIKMIADAEANGASLKIQGESYVMMRDLIAKGNAQAIKKMTEGTGLTDTQAMHLLTMIDSNDAVRDAAKAGSTVVVATGNSSEHAVLGMVAAQQ